MNPEKSFYLINLSGLQKTPYGEKFVHYTADLPQKTERHYIESFDELFKTRSQGGVIWVSGGGAYIINDTWIPLVRRSLESPTNPGRLTIATGRSDTEAELENPSLMIRELFEEIVIVKRDSHSLLVPRLSTEIFADQDIGSIIQNAAGRAQISFSDIINSPAALNPRFHTDRLTVTFQGHVLSDVHVSLHHDAETGEFNLIYAVNLRIETAVEELDFFDTECDGQKPLRREIYLYHVPSRVFYRQTDQGLSQADSTGIELTPHARFFIDRAHQVLSR